MKTKVVDLIFILSMSSICVAFVPQDCTYNVTEYHVEYMCGVNDGYMFGRRTHQYLYCNNYPSGIKRSEIQELSFFGCKRREIADDYLDVFTNLRILNISFTEIEKLLASDLRFSKHVERLIASNNRLTVIPVDLFTHTPDLIEVNFSYNQVTRLEMFVFSNARKLVMVDLSFNQIESLTAPVFSYLIDLEVLDISNNRINSMDNDVFEHNTKLKQLRLNNNQMKRLSCGFLVTFTESKSLEISLNTLETVETSCTEDKSSIDLNIKISSESTATQLRINEGHFEWIFTHDDFINIRHLNLSNSRIENITLIMQESSPLLETLDLSNNFIGELSAKTFEKFRNLKNLNLRQTNVTNFEFSTFYHQRNLQELDISYNKLNRVNFYLFLRNFQSLESLNLEGNNLTEIDSVTRSHFPKLAVLGISKNNFSCDYLVKFLLQWHDLKLIDNPSNQTHIGGVDCVHRNATVYKELNSNNVTFVPENIPINYAQSHLDELQEIKRVNQYLLVFMGLLFTLICIPLTAAKCKHFIKNSQDKRNHLIDHSVIFDKNCRNSNPPNEHHYIELLH